jgi:cell division protein FtsQ
MGEKRKRRIRNGIIALASLAMITGFVVLFVAASRDRGEAACRAVHLAVKGNPDHLYIDEGDIRAKILGTAGLNPVGKPLSTLKMQELERSVKAFPWVADAELYLDNDNVLQVLITEKVPRTRVFTTSGGSFYLDAYGAKLPVTGSFVSRMPVVTGFPDTHSLPGGADSALVAGVTALSAFLSSHPFWMAQVSQVNINGQGEFELIPTVGSALVEFGTSNDLEEKFSKLLTFYSAGLNNVGWGYYDTLDVRFRGQVVATRKKSQGNPVVDSLMTRDSYANSTGSTPQLKMRSGAAAEVTWTETNTDAKTAIRPPKQ